MILLGEEATALSPWAYLPARNKRWVDKRDRISSFLNFQHKIFVLKFYVIGKEKKKVFMYLFLLSGKIECQMLMEEKSPILQLKSLFEAIQLSLRHDQNSR